MLQLEFCPKCKTRLVPRPAEVKRLRQLAGLTQRQLAALLKVKASHIAYLESGTRYPSGRLILRYRAVENRLLRNAKKSAAARLRELRRRASNATTAQ